MSWYVRPQGKADSKLGGDSVFSVMLQQPFPDVARGHANNRVLAGVVRRSPSKQLYADDSLFQGCEPAGNRLFHYVGEELTGAMASLKSFSLDHFLEMLLEPGKILLGLHNFCYPGAALGS